MEKKIDIDEYLDETVVVKYRIRALLMNIHGEYARRTQDLSQIVFDTSEITKEEELQKEKKTKKTRKNVVEVSTFPRDEKGNLLVPIGGKHGYLYGALRVAMNDLYKDKLTDRKWRGYGLKTNIEHGIYINPEWVPIGNKVSNQLNKPKLYLTFKPNYVEAYYDYVEKAEIEFTIELTNKKIPEDILLRMIAHIQRLGIGPKGRGKLKIIEVRRVK